MLLTFSFKNYGPYRDESMFDMRAVPSYKEHEYNVMSSGGGEDTLKVAVVYGANASGKSAFVEAYDTFRALVLFSFRAPATDPIDADPREGPAPKEKRPFISDCYVPFALSGRKEDTEFEAEFDVGETRFRYGFTYNSKEVTSEWLYTFNLSASTRRTTMLLERSGPSSDEISLGASVRGECKKYLGNIPRDVLALSYFSSLNLKTDRFAAAVSGVASVLTIPKFVSDNGAAYLDSYFMYSYQDEDKQGLLDYLGDADISIKDIEVEKNEKDVRVRTLHVGPDGREYTLPLWAESTGTRKLIYLYSFVSKATSLGRGLIIDELDSGLHPLVVRHIVSKFHASDSRGQLIFTAHDVSLLNKRYLRRDQVWFVSKDDGNCSALRSLSDFRVRGSASYDTAYLAGVFGSIPNIANRV